jgi:hypothetical protein
LTVSSDFAGVVRTASWPGWSAPPPRWRPQRRPISAGACDSPRLERSPDDFSRRGGFRPGTNEKPSAQRHTIAFAPHTVRCRERISSRLASCRVGSSRAPCRDLQFATSRRSCAPSTHCRSRESLDAMPRLVFGGDPRSHCQGYRCLSGERPWTRKPSTPACANS